VSDGRDDTQARPAGEFIERRDELIKLWALAPTWTLREGACLANNVSPRLLSEHGNFPRRHPAAERVNRLIEFALRSMRQFKLSTDPTPAVFIAWSEGVGFPFDAKWIEVIGKPRIPAESKIDDSKGSLGASPKRERGQPGARNKRILAARHYVRLFSAFHEAENLSWQGACNAIVDDGGETVVPKTLKRGLKELGIR